jgi:hypothetical protein
MTPRIKLFWKLLTLYILSVVVLLFWKNTGTIILTCVTVTVYITFLIKCFNSDVKKQEQDILSKNKH